MKKDENLYDDELDTSILENYYHQHKRKEKKILCNATLNLSFSALR